MRTTKAAMLKSLALLLLVSAACSAIPPRRILRPSALSGGRIVGGDPVDISQYPWQVSLRYYGSHMCGGSIISSNWVLTAAHCIPYAGVGQKVRAGSSNVDSGGDIYEIAESFAHESYYGHDYDIGLVRISGSFAFGENVQAVALGDNELAGGAKVSITGWGDMWSGGVSPSHLRGVNTTIVDRAQCNEMYGGGITDRMICAGEPEGGKDSCQGDSGGPLVSGNVQYGIVSWGYGCADPDYPGVYANVADLRSWISKHAGV